MVFLHKTPTVKMLQDARSRLMRCTVIRYLNLGILMTFCMIAPGVRAAYPSLEHFVDAGE